MYKVGGYVVTIPTIRAWAKEMGIFVGPDPPVGTRPGDCTEDLAIAPNLRQYFEDQKAPMFSVNYIDYPRMKENPIAQILLWTRHMHDPEATLTKFTEYIEMEDSAEVKQWLERRGLPVGEFTTIVDPFKNSAYMHDLEGPIM